jgi:hypothetical protein
MKYSIANLSIIPVRKEPSEPSEMVTQILFGEHFKIIEETTNWTKILTSYDNYEGWISSLLVNPITDEVFEDLQNSELFVVSDMVCQITCPKRSPQLIVAGSTLPFLNPEKKTFFMDGLTSFYNGNFTHKRGLNLRFSIVFYALKYINTPYLWGGRSPFGIDCSGFTQIVYKLNGIKIPRDASAQVKTGRLLNSSGEIKVGDLAFFQNDNGKIIHVGIILKDNKIIHASGKVRIDRVDEKGIFNEEIGKYTHKLHSIKNLLDEF